MQYATRQREARALSIPVFTTAEQALRNAVSGDVLAVTDPDALLPYASDRFDAATCAFGHMFSADPRRALADLFRVVRPGGTVALTAFRRIGPVGTLLSKAAELDPPTTPAPLSWAREERLRQDLEVHSDDVTFSYHELTAEPAHLFVALPPLIAVPDQRPLREIATVGSTPFILARARKRW